MDSAAIASVGADIEAKISPSGSERPNSHFKLKEAATAINKIIITVILIIDFQL